MAKRLPMTGWFNPGLLVQAGIREAVSTVFGRYADRREAIAASNAIAAMPADEMLHYCDHKGDFWFDYLADTGDGWNPTYAMARLISAPSIEAGGEVLTRGRLLLLGGDQVYPSASRQDYEERFRAPFEEAWKVAGAPQDGEAPHLYALPGDHDWHDGLNAFFGLFCRRRTPAAGTLGFARDGAVIAGRETRQTRSYFALALPHGWWLWGTDSQMEGYIDQPQIDYFSHVASKWMEPRSKVILCVSEPVWANAVSGRIEDRYRSFNYLERLAGLAKHPETGDRMGHELKLVLTGDSHHYSRFVEENASGRQYVTCGGGGAFTSATHQLGERTIPSEYPPPGVDGAKGKYDRTFTIADEGRSRYPEKLTSYLLALRNVAFPILNWQFTLLLAGIFLVLNWLLAFNAAATGRGDFATLLAQGGFADALEAYGGLTYVSPAVPVILAVLLFACWAVADASDKAWLRILLGVGHALAHFAAVAAVTVLTVRLLGHWWDGGWGSAALLVAAGLVSGLVSAFVMGFYFIFCMVLLRRQTGYGFSGLRIQSRKSFLRLRIATDGVLTVHAVGLKKVPRDDGEKPKNPSLHPHLIERVEIGP
ncbi:MAG TPA: hypothetical protein VF603_00810 [Allosphingosinicella sp.]|jgi:hypothetical protein